VVLSIIVFMLFLFSSYFISTNQDIIQNLGFYQNKYEEMIPKVILFFEQFNISFEWGSVIKAIEPGKLIRYITGFFSNMGNILLDISLTILLLMFLLLESNTILEKLSHLIHVKENQNIIDTFFKSINRYFLIKTLTSLLTGFLIWILLSYFQLPHAFFFALIAFILNYIPSIGSLIAAFFAIFISLLQLTMIDTVLISLGYLVVNIVVGNFLEPKIMGDRLNLSTFVVFSSMVIWGWIFGFLGMFLAVPLTLIIDLACENSKKYHWVSMLLKDNLSNKGNS
jgi:AI-2 transport protein TqsA